MLVTVKTVLEINNDHLIFFEDFFDRIQYYGCLYYELAYETSYVNLYIK